MRFGKTKTTAKICPRTLKWYDPAIDVGRLRWLNIEVHKLSIPCGLLWSSIQIRCSPGTGQGSRLRSYRSSARPGSRRKPEAVAILDQAFDRLVVFAPQMSTKVSNAARAFLVSAIQISWSARLAFGCWPSAACRARWRSCEPSSAERASGPDLVERLPEAERAIGDRKLRRHRKPAPLEIEQQLSPRLGALAHAVDQADEFLLALRRRADDDQQALGVILEAGLHMNAVGPEVDVTLGRKIALAPTRMLLGPGICQSAPNRDPLSASKRDPFARQVRAVALAPSELVRGCGDGASAACGVIVSAAFQAPAVVSGFDNIAVMG